MTRRAGSFAALTLLMAVALASSPAAARNPTPPPSTYPSIGPTTSTTTIAVSYPTVAPPSTTPVPTTAPTTAPSQTAPTVPPTSGQPAPPPSTSTTTTSTLPANATMEDGRLVYYEVGEEHVAITLNVSQLDGASYSLLSPPHGATISPGGVLQWIPNEASGGSTVTIGILMRRADQSTQRIDARLLIAETNSAPTIDGPATATAFPGKTIELVFTAIDTDDPANSHEWRVESSTTATITEGVLRWAVPADQPPEPVTIRVIATDNGSPTRRTSLAVSMDIVDTSEAAILAVDADGDPVNPYVIAASDDGAAPLMVDLDEPGQLVTALAARTPNAAARPASAQISKVSGALRQSAVLTSVRQTFQVLLELEVPTTAVGGGLAWQFMILVGPGFITRRRRIYDIIGIAPGSEIGDGVFRFRNNAAGLEGGPLRRHNGQWMRAITSPLGPVWIPTTHLRASPLVPR